ERIERILDVRHVHDRDVAPGKGRREAIPAHHAIVLAALTDSRRHLIPTGFLGVVEILDYQHLRAIDLPVRMYPAVEARLPGDRSIAGRVDEAGRADAHIAVARGDIERGQPPPIAVDLADDAAGERRHAGRQHRLLDPAAQRHLVV